MRWARMCYDHIAGAVGVAMTEALMARAGLCAVNDGWTAGNASVFAELDLDVGTLPRRGRPLARPCMDWSERRHHLAGSLGAALTGELVRRDWLRPREGTRIVTVTPEGVAGLRNWLGLDVDRLRSAA